MGVNLMELYHTMGWFAKGVVFVLAIMSIYSLTIVFTKAAQFIRSASMTRKFMPEFSRAIQEE
ncbi:MAG: flagellar motor protein MotA, partial [Gemmatimonadales bacterium]